MSRAESILRLGPADATPTHVPLASSAGLARMILDAASAVTAGERPIVSRPQWEAISAWYSRGADDPAALGGGVIRRLPAGKQTLSLEQSERALRLARLAAHASRVFGDEDKARSWLRRPNRALDDRPPLELARTETGAAVVEELLVQIDHGHYV